MVISGSSPRARGTRRGALAAERGRRIIPARAGNTPPTHPRRSSGTDHPRARGEHLMDPQHARESRGSSPRARGTRQLSGIASASAWIIPARAGNTVPALADTLPVTDHPRARGEHNICRPFTSNPIGSSPRARGTRSDGPPTHRERRIIPARAGNTFSRLACAAIHSDHPRARGEHAHPVGVCKGSPGSSPRARGTLGGEVDRDPARRIIPARAGNTNPRSGAPVCPADHPRARGEHNICRPFTSNPIGSSPRARGTQSDGPPTHRERRIIPARAGNTFSRLACAAIHSDHPRARGEHAHPVGVCKGSPGSSPRARGTLGGEVDRDPARRIIPARAGNTNPRSGAPVCPADHPRARGEHILDGVAEIDAHGSSPRARGTRRPARVRPLSARIIPARAGNTVAAT